MKKGSKYYTQRLSYGAICIALAFTLSYITLYKMPQGGTITPCADLPLIIYSFWFGPLYGIIAGILYGLLQFMQDPYMLSWSQFLLDYIVAFGAIGLAGLFGKTVMRNASDNTELPRLLAATVVAEVSRFAAAVASGAIFWGEYAWEGWDVWPYSLAYNGAYMGPNLAITLAVVAVLALAGVMKRIRPSTLK